MTPPSLAVRAHIDRTFPLAKGMVIFVNNIDITLNRVDGCERELTERGEMMTEHATDEFE